MKKCLLILLLTFISWLLIYNINAQISFKNVSSSAGISGSYFTHSVIWADCDNDQDLDIFVVHFHGTQLYKNQGNGSFLLISNQASLPPDAFAYTAVMGDYDNDGDLDIAIGGEGTSSNLKLFRNDNNTYVDISLAAGIGYTNEIVFSLT